MWTASVEPLPLILGWSNSLAYSVFCLVSSRPTQSFLKFLRVELNLPDLCGLSSLLQIATALRVDKNKSH